MTLAFVIGLYLPSAAVAPDLARHFGEALHNWAIVFFVPLALGDLFGLRFCRLARHEPRQHQPAER